jgi:magnesium-transporting ATPase (P-type)
MLAPVSGSTSVAVTTIGAASPPAVYQLLESSPRGLSTGEAAARRARHGDNSLPPPQRPSVLRRFGAQFTDLFALVLLGAAALTLLAYLLQQPRDIGNVQLAVAIVGVVVLNAVIGFAQEYSAERTVQALQAMVPRTCRVLRDGERRDAPVSELVPGDVIALDAGDAVPADCRLVEANEFTVDNAALTGESEPVGRDARAEATGVVVLELGQGRRSRPGSRSRCRANPGRLGSLDSVRRRAPGRRWRHG